MIAAPAAVSAGMRYMRLPGAHETHALLSYLTPKELARAGAIRSETRRREHVASRVLAKLLVLRRFQCDAPICEIGIGQRGGIPAREYQEIEIVRADGAPRVFRKGVVLADLYLSIAHSAGITAVGVSTDTPIGADVATVEMRAPSFSRVHYTQCEHEWINRGGDASSNVLHTLLWTLKESVVKAGGAPHATLWGYDEVEVLVDGSPRDVAERLAAGEVMTTAIRLPSNRVASASFMRTANTILSLVADIQEA